MPSATASPSPEYRPGDRVRVTTDKPYATELLAGDIVTVIEQATKIEPDDSELPVVRVNTAAGLRWLGLDVVELFVSEYAPAEPDEVVDAQLRAIVTADEELATLLADADTALGAGEETLSGQLDDEPTGEGEGGRDVRNRFTATDYAGASLEVAYFERDSKKRGNECLFSFDINDDDDPVIIPAAAVGPLIAFLLDRARFAKRPR